MVQTSSKYYFGFLVGCGRFTVVGSGVGGIAVAVGLGVAVAVAAGVAPGTNVAVGAGVGPGVEVGPGVAVGVGTAEARRASLGQPWMLSCGEVLRRRLLELTV